MKRKEITVKVSPEVFAQMEKRRDRSGLAFQDVGAACFQAWAEGHLHIDPRGNLSLAEPSHPLVRATADTVALVDAFSQAVSHPRTDDDRALRHLVGKILKDRIEK